MTWFSIEMVPEKHPENSFNQMDSDLETFSTQEPPAVPLPSYGSETLHSDVWPSAYGIRMPLFSAQKWFILDAFAMPWMVYIILARPCSFEFSWILDDSAAACLVLAGLRTWRNAWIETWFGGWCLTGRLSTHRITRRSNCTSVAKFYRHAKTKTLKEIGAIMVRKADCRLCRLQIPMQFTL